MRPRLWIAASLALLVPVAHAVVVDKNVGYAVNGDHFQGYLAYDAANKKPKALVIVFHDWDGVNDHEKMVCRKLAQAGYVAFAADVFGQAKVDTIAQRQAVTQKLYGDVATFRARVRRSYQIAVAQPYVARNKTVAIGYCFGGSSALELARSGVDMKGVVTFHGSLGTSKPMAKGTFHGKVLVLAGGADPFVPAGQVAGLKAEMKAAGVSTTVVSYPGVGHAFTVKGSEKMGMKGVGYNAHADKASWKDLIAFLKTTLK